MSQSEVSQKLLKEYRELREQKSELESNARRCGVRMDAIEEIFSTAKFRHASGRFGLLHEWVETSPRISKAHIIEVRGEEFYEKLMAEIKDECGGEKLKCEVVLASTAKLAAPQRYRFKKKRKK